MPTTPDPSTPPAQSTRPAPPSQPTRRGLWVARALAVPGSLAALGGLAYLGAAGLAGHGGGGNMLGALLVVGLVVAVLPLLLFWPDGDGGSVAVAHGVGGVSLVVMLFVASVVLWSRFGAAGARSGSIQATLKHVSILDTRIEPLQVGPVTAGYRLTMRFQLASQFKAGEQKSLIASTLSHANLVPLDGAETAPDRGAFFYYDDGVTRLVRPGGPTHVNDMLAGVYTLTKEIWMPFLDRPSHWAGPCRRSYGIDTPSVKERVEAIRATRWVAQVRALAPNAKGQHETVWQARSTPISLDYDGRAWLQGLAALALPDCHGGQPAAPRP